MFESLRLLRCCSLLFTSLGFAEKKMGVKSVWIDLPPIGDLPPPGPPVVCVVVHISCVLSRIREINTIKRSCFAGIKLGLKSV